MLDAFQRVLRGDLEVVQRVAQAVGHEVAPHRPSRGGLVHDRADQPAEQVQQRGVAVRQLPGQEAGQAARGRVEHVVGAAVENTRGQPMLGRGGARREVAAEAEPGQHDPLRVDIRPGQQVVHYGGDDVLPVRAERHPAVDEHGALARAVERQHVVAALQRRGAVGEVQFLGRAVIPGDQDHRGARCRVGGGAEVVARQEGVLVGDLHDLGRHREQRRAAAEAVHLPPVRLHQPRIGRDAHREQPRGAEVVGGTEEPVAGAGCLPGRLAGLRLLVQLCRRCHPGVMPGVQAGLGNLPGHGQALSGIGTAVRRIPDRAQQLCLEQLVLHQLRHHRSSLTLVLHMFTNICKTIAR
jgi:hypothetical protein